MRGALPKGTHAAAQGWEARSRGRRTPPNYLEKVLVPAPAAQRGGGAGADAHGRHQVSPARGPVAAACRAVEADVQCAPERGVSISQLQLLLFALNLQLFLDAAELMTSKEEESGGVC
jgi:hypothetical protein